MLQVLLSLITNIYSTKFFANIHGVVERLTAKTSAQLRHSLRRFDVIDRLRSLS